MSYLNPEHPHIKSLVKDVVYKQKAYKKVTATVLNKLISKLGTTFVRQYKWDRFLGEGAYGAAYLIKKNGHERVLKIQEQDRASSTRFLRAKEKENAMQKKFYMLNQQNSKIKLTVKVHDFYIWERSNGKIFAITEMDRIDGVISDLLQYKQNEVVLHVLATWFEAITDLMCKHKLTHGDMHTGNIGYIIMPNKLIRPVLIDFGWASAGSCDKQLEMIQLLRGLMLDYKHNAINKSNYAMLAPLFLQDYTRLTGKKMNFSFKAVDDEWKRRMDRYEKTFNKRIFGGQRK